MTERTVHHGRNIKRIREIQGVKQEALALELGDDWNQKKISLLESKERIDDKILGQVAEVLHVTPEAIENFNDDFPINIIANTFHDQAVNMNYQCTFNPIEKIIELYDALLKSEKEKNELLERLLAEKK